ncbi:MAG: CapA family protein [Paludibacter sp.]|nr:CapA family protein [Paludibacter sp.]
MIKTKLKNILIFAFLFSFINVNVFASDTLKIVAVGDIMMGTSYPNSSFLPPDNDAYALFANVKKNFDKGNIVFGNLEGAMTDSHTNVKSCSNPDVCYAFAMPTEFGKALKKAGINLMSIANNHTGDFGDAGRQSTANALKTNKIHFAGLVSCPTDTFTLNGVKYGFVAFAPNNGTVNINDIAEAENIVRELNKTCNIVIVSMHAGAEGVKYQHVTRNQELFLGENRGNVYQFAHRMIDAGADVILGHGPHVSRAIEIYKDRFITYSMGNFLTYSRINVAGVSGLAPIYTIETDKNGKFLRATLTSTRQEKSKPVIIDSEKQVLEVIKNLTFSDFPEMKNKIIFGENGEITYKN